MSQTSNIRIAPSLLASDFARLSQQVVDEVRDFFDGKVFETLIPRTVRLSEAPSFGQPITLYDPNGKGADAYRSLAKEVVSRV